MDIQVGRIVIRIVVFNLSVATVDPHYKTTTDPGLQ